MTKFIHFKDTYLTGKDWDPWFMSDLHKNLDDYPHVPRRSKDFAYTHKHVYDMMLNLQGNWAGEIKALFFFFAHQLFRILVLKFQQDLILCQSISLHVFNIMVCFL